MKKISQLNARIIGRDERMHLKGGLALVGRVLFYCESSSGSSVGPNCGSSTQFGGFIKSCCLDQVGAGYSVNFTSTPCSFNFCI